MTRLGRLVSWLLTLVLCVSAIPVPALAYASQGAEVLTGTYTYTTSQRQPGTGEDHTDTYEFRDSWFRQPSSVESNGIALVTMQLAMAARNAGTVEGMLKGMGFDDLRSNAYFTKGVCLASSVGVTIGRRTLMVGNVPYTLLAVIPRSNDYDTEWLGNVQVSMGNVHEGFKAARDEILRFLRAYVTETGVSGRVKVWCGGHSRLAAVSGMVGGFLADGGATYVGNRIAIDPQDVYCYCTATPSYIKNGTPKSEVMSVEGARGGEYAALDTPGEAFVSTAAGTVDLTDATYRGIRNYLAPSDVVPYVPPAQWGFARYGQVLGVDGNGNVPVSNMMAELQTLNKGVYDRYVAGGDPQGFTWVSLDVPQLDLNDLRLEALAFKETPDAGDGTLQESLKRRVQGLVSVVPSNAAYVERGYQDIFGAAVGLVFLARVVDDPQALLAKDKDMSLLRSIVFGHLDYARQRMGLPAGASGDAVATTEVLRQLVRYLTEVPNDLTTASDLVEALGKFVCENEGSPLVQSLLDKVISVVQSNDMVMENLDMILGFLANYHPGTERGSGDDASRVDGSTRVGAAGESDTEREALGILLASVLAPNIPAASDDLSAHGLVAQDEGTTNEKLAQLKVYLVDFLKALYAGSDSQASVVLTAQEVRDFLFTTLSFAPLPDAAAGLMSAINPSEGESGTGALEDVVKAALPLFLGGDATLAEASNTCFDEGIDKTLGMDSNTQHYAALLKGRSPQVHSLLNNALFSVEGAPYSLDYNICVLSTLAKNANVLLLSHYFEEYVAWARARFVAQPDSSPVVSEHVISGPHRDTYGHDSATVATATVAAERLGGSNRYDTMAALSQAAFDRAEVAVLAVGTDYPDALAASSLAGALSSPIILTDGARLSPQALSELKRLGAKKVYAIGGPQVVQDAVLGALRSEGMEVQRVAGADRSDTSLKVMDAALVAGGSASTIVVASGANFADALSIGAWCYALKAPIVLTGTDGLLTQAALEAIAAHPHARVVVVGGASSVGNVESQLGAGHTVTRLAGADRYATSVAVATWAGANGLSWFSATLAAGKDFPDSLAGAAFAGSKGSVMLLADSSSKLAADVLSSHKGAIQRLFVLGGEASMPASLVQDLQRAAA